jgi:hypothetical protein
MNVRRLALSATAVAVMAGAGLVVTASPAAAMDDDCPALLRARIIAARLMDRYLGVDFEAWNQYYDLWQLLDENITQSEC